MPGILSTKKPNAINDVESELTGLQRRRSSLQARADAAAAALEIAKAARRDLLVGSDDPPPVKLSASDRAVREAEDARGAAADAGQEIEARIADLGSKLAALLEAEQNEQRAAEIEANAAMAEAAIARLRKAAKEIDAARHALAEAIGSNASDFYDPPTVHPEQSWTTYLGKTWFDFSGNNTREMTVPMDAVGVSSRIVAHIIAPALPQCAITSVEEVMQSRTLTGGPTRSFGPVDDPAAVRKLIVEPMRAAAAALRVVPKIAA